MGKGIGRRVDEVRGEITCIKTWLLLSTKFIKSFP